uniref:Predicted gene 4779 n=1 Tax=Peromyscus maniculatus bairdii TaxID=230844 RepID=A0A8C8VWR5_PERMB
MSSPDEVSVRGSGFGPESGEHSEGRRRFSHGSPRRHGLGPGSEDKTCLPVSKTFQYDSWLDRDEMEGRSVVWGCEGRPGTPVDERGDSLDFVPQLTIEGTSFGQHVANREAWGVRRHPSPKSGPAEPLGIWGDSDAGTSRRGMRPPTSVEGKQVSASQQHPRGLGRGRAWVTPRRGATSRIIASEDFQFLSSDPESSDEFSETELMRVTICLKEGGQAKSTGLTELEDTGRRTNVRGRGSFVHMPPSLLVTTPRGLSSGGEKQALGELEGSLSKKKPSGVWGKEGSRPSYPGAAVASSAAAPAPVASASGASPTKTSPRKKGAAKEKPTQWDASRGSLGRTFPPWGQRLKSAPVEPATFPPISGVALLGKASKCSLPSGPKECKPFCTGKRSMARKTKESQPGAKEDNDPTRDPGLQAQLPTHRAEQPCTCTHRGEMSSGDPNTRAPQVAGNSQFLSLSQRSARPRAPAPAGDQDILVCPLLPAEEGEPVLQGTPGCPQCLMLRKEIEELKEQLAIMQALNEKFQDL